MLNHLAIFVEDLRHIFLKQRGIKKSSALLWAHLRIKTKQVIFRATGLGRQHEKFMGLEFAFPDYGQFAHLWREIFILENYYFQSDTGRPYIVDAGSNIGMSICFFKYLYPDAVILGFEPDPNAFKWLKLNVEINHFKDVVIHNVALGLKDGRIKFYEHPTEVASGLNSVRLSAFGDGKPVVIEMDSRRLSSFIHREVDLLKVDIEGGEYDVFKDLDEKDKLRNMKQIFLEVHQGHGTTNDPISSALDILERGKFRYAVTDTFISHHSFIGSPSKPYAFMLDARRVGREKS